MLHNKSFIVISVHIGQWSHRQDLQEHKNKEGKEYKGRKGEDKIKLEVVEVHSKTSIPYIKAAKITGVGQQAIITPITPQC